MLHDYLWRVMLGSCFALALSGCKSSDVGAPCIPEEEYHDGFSGFSVDEVNFESRSFQCESRTCLVNHFQGRVSCPYGQSEAQGRDNPACLLPGGGEPVRAPVAPQVLARRADEAVYCSCRCDGPDPNARYCECPSGFTCTQLVPGFASRDAELAGSYCIREGSEYDRTRVLTEDACDRSLANCE